MDQVNTLQVELNEQRVELKHGSGGKAMANLIKQAFASKFANKWLNQYDDAALLSIPGNRIVMTTDAHIVSPLFFPGGDIGCLSINGTINDIAMMGAKPLYLSASFILEEGLPLSTLNALIDSMAHASRAASVPVVAGDTKVVERGKGDGIFITTTGIGYLQEGIAVSGAYARPGDKIIVSGTIGDHGIAVMSKRENLQFVAPIQSDTVALHELVESMLNAVPDIHCLRDPTRGGLATSLNELAQQSKCGFILDEEKIPIRIEVQSASELLGIEPLYIANEGKLIAICSAKDAKLLLQTMRSHKLGQQSTIIGEVIEDKHQLVQLKTKFGGMRILDWLSGEQLPRIC